MKIIERLIEKFGVEVINKEGLAAILAYVANNVGANNVLELMLEGPTHIEYNEEKVKNVLRDKGYDIVSILNYKEKPVEHEFYVEFTKYTERYFEKETDEGNGYYYKTDDHPIAKKVLINDYDNIPYDKLA